MAGDAQVSIWWAFPPQPGHPYLMDSSSAASAVGNEFCSSAASAVGSEFCSSATYAVGIAMYLRYPAQHGNL